MAGADPEGAAEPEHLEEPADDVSGSRRLAVSRGSGLFLRAPLRGLARFTQERKLWRWGLALALTWLATWALLPRFGPLQLIAPALTAAVMLPVVLGSMRRGWRKFRGLRAAPWIEGTLVIVGFVAFGMVLFPKVFFHDTLIDLSDHHIMRARAQLIAEGLARGEWPRWSHAFQGGDSLVDLYPSFASYASALLHFLMPAGTPFVKTYSIFCVLLWSLRGIAVYNLCRRFSGPLISLVVAIVSAYELGNDIHDGTWVAFFYWGMIHNNLAISCALFAVAAQVDLYRRVTAGAIVALVLAAVAAIFSHLLGFLYVTVSCGAVAFAMLLGSGRRNRSLRVLGVTALGIAAAAIWILPNTYGMAHYSLMGSGHGPSYSELAEGLFDAKTPNSSFPAFYGVVILAIVASLASRHTLRIFIAMIAILLIVLSMTNWLIQSHVLTFIPAYADGQHRRALTCAKVAALPVVAALLAQLARRIRFNPRLSPGSVAAHAMLLIVFVTGFGRVVCVACHKLHRALVDQVPTATMRVDGLRTHQTSADHVAAMRWIAEVRKADPSATPWRVMLWGTDHSQAHVHWFWAQGVDMGVPMVDYGWPSAVFLANRPRKLTAEGFRTWNIRYLVTPKEGTPFPELTLRHTEGIYKVWELVDYDDRFVVAPEHVRISNVQLVGDDIGFDVEGAKDGADVRIRTAYYPRWSAEQDGRRIGVRPTPARADAVKEDQLVAFVKDGRVRLSYGAPPPRFFWGLTLSCLGVLGTIFILARRRRRWLAAAAGAALGRVSRLATAVASSRSYPRLLLAGAATLTLSLIAIGVYAGRSRLLPAPIEGWGMQVQMQRTGGAVRDCNASIARGLYECMSGERRLVQVNAAMGATPVQDDSAEWAKLWPSTRVHLIDGSTTATIHFSRVAIRSTLKLKTQSSGGVELVVISGGVRSKTLVLEGAQVHFVELPRGGPSKLSIELKPLRDDVWAHFWGAL